MRVLTASLTCVLMVCALGMPASALEMGDSANWEGGYEFTVDPTGGWSAWAGNPAAVTSVSDGVLNFKPTSPWTLWKANNAGTLGTGDWSYEWRAAVVSTTGTNPLLYADNNSSNENVGFQLGFAGSGQIYGQFQASPSSPVTAGIMGTGGLDYSAYHVYRMTRTTGVTGTLFNMYLDDSPAPIITRDLVMTAKNSDNWLGFGNGSATGEFNLDYIRWTTTGAYKPALEMGRGHKALLKWGLQIQPHTTPQLWTEDFDVDLWASAHFTAVDFGSGPTYPVDFMPPAPGLPWANLTFYTGQLDPVEEPYADMLIRLSIQDEQDIRDPNELAALVPVITNLHNRYPHVIVHTNQGTPRTMAEVRNYMQIVKPDMLMFDDYPFGAVEYSGVSPTHLYEYLERYRKLGLEGNDGTGTQPIPTGVFVRTFTTIHPSLPNASVVSESEIRLQYFSAWAFGYKLVDTFIYDDKPEGSYVDSIMFDGPGTGNPTPAFYQVAETNRQSLNLGPALVRLISSDVRFIVGRHNGQFNSLPDGVASWNSGADPYITDITATNLGSKNDGLEGDVIVGYFKTLSPEFTNAGHENDIYFMIVNGLSDTGLASETLQEIRLDFDFGASGIDSLVRLSRDTGQTEVVDLVSDGGSLYHLDLVLEGGTGDLFKFNNGGVFVPEPTSLALLLIGAVLLRRSCRR